MSVTGPTRKCSLHVNPPAGSLDAKSIRSCLKCWRLIDLTVTSPPAGEDPQFLARYAVFPNVRWATLLFYLYDRANAHQFIMLPLNQYNASCNGKLISIGFG